MVKVLTQVYINKEEEGGRKSPIFNNYRANLRFNNSESRNDFILKADDDTILIGGGNYEIFFKPLYYDLVLDFLKTNNEFEILEGAKIIARGKIIDTFKDV